MPFSQWLLKYVFFQPFNEAGFCHDIFPRRVFFTAFTNMCFLFTVFTEIYFCSWHFIEICLFPWHLDKKCSFSQPYNWRGRFHKYIKFQVWLESRCLDIFVNRYVTRQFIYIYIYIYSEIWISDLLCLYWPACVIPSMCWINSDL